MGTAIKYKGQDDGTTRIIDLYSAEQIREQAKAGTGTIKLSDTQLDIRTDAAPPDTIVADEYLPEPGKKRGRLLALFVLALAVSSLYFHIQDTTTTDGAAVVEKAAAPVVTEAAVEPVTEAAVEPVAESVVTTEGTEYENALGGIEPEPAIESVSDEALVRASLSEESALTAPAETTNVMPEINFDPNVAAAQQNINAQANALTYSKTAKRSKQSGFTPIESNGKAAVRSHTGSTGLRPVPKSDGRYVSGNGTEWQAGWELHNPAGNAARGQNYLRSIGQRFNLNAGKSFRTKGKAPSGLSKDLPAGAKENMPILRYGGK